MKLIDEFKEFISRGNVLDMAVGVVVGSAFSKIVSSLVGDIIMPLVAVITAGTDVSGIKLLLKAATEDAEAVYLSYGAFIQSVIDFFIVSFCIFAVIKAVNEVKRRVEKKKPEEPAAPAGPTQEELLTDIKALLEKNLEK